MIHTAELSGTVTPNQNDRQEKDNQQYIKQQYSLADIYSQIEQRDKKIRILQKRLKLLKDQAASISQLSNTQKNRKQIIIIDLQQVTETDVSSKIKVLKDYSSQCSTNELVKEVDKKQQVVCLKSKDQKIQSFHDYPRRIHRRHKVISKRTLELLCKRFQQYYACQNHSHYKGRKVTLNQFSQFFDINLDIVNDLYKEWLVDPTFYDRIVRSDLFKKVPQKKLTIQRLEHVGRLIKENPFMTLNQICVQLNKIEDLKSLKDGERQEITRTTVARLLKIGKYKKKRVRSVPKERNTSKQLEKRYQFCAKYKQLLDKQAKIYFLDQSGFNLYMIREKAWSRPSQEITVNCPVSKGKRFSLIAIIGEDGLAHWRIIDGNYRKYEYLDFIRQLFEKLYYSNDQSHQKWLIMDNCSIHDKEETMKLAGKWNVKVMYLPAYSPQLNPIQMWFHEVKTKVRKINYAGQRQLLEIMQRTLKGYEDYDFSNYYHGSLKFVEKGLRKQKF